MKDANTLTVREINGAEWRAGRVTPFNQCISLSRLLDMVQATGQPLEAEPNGRLDGEHAGSYVFALPTLGNRAYFIVQAYALPLLQGYTSPTQYRDATVSAPSAQLTK